MVSKDSLCLVPRLRISGALPSLSPSAFMAWRGTLSILPKVNSSKDFCIMFDSHIIHIFVSIANS